MPVKYLELENFKSYSGITTIGPFERFTSIIGPNGSGKSNVMDAISFVLGVHSKELRSQKLSDLVYTQNKALPCSAKLVYEDEDAGEIHFQRCVKNSTSSYKVNDESVTRAEYEAALLKIGVNLQAKNFLVFQGDVEALARKSPSELLELVETIAGIDETLKEKYNELEKRKEALESDRLYIAKQKKSIESERNIWKSQKLEAQEFQRLQEDFADHQITLYLFLLWQLELDKEARAENLEELEGELNEKNAVELAASSELNNLKQQVSRIRRSVRTADNTRLEKIANLETLNMDALERKKKTLEGKITKEESALAKAEDNKTNHKETLEKLTAQIAECQATLEGLKNDDDDDDENVDFDPTILRKLELQKSKLTTLQGSLSSATASQETAQAELNGDLDRVKKIETSLKTNESKLASIEEKLRNLNAQSREATKVRNELDTKIEKLSIVIRDAKNADSFHKEQERLKTTIANMPTSGTIHGRLVDLCRPVQRKYSTAVTVAAGKDMDAIVVDTKQTAVECIQYLRDQKIGTAVFLPLDTIKTPDNLDRIRSRLSDGYKLAVDVIAVQDDVKKAVQYAVGNTVICNDLNDARDLCFTKKMNVKAVTLAGAVISKAGTMTGGSTNANTARWDYENIQKSRTELEKFQAQREEIEVPSSSKIEELRNERSTVQNSIQFQKSDLKFTETRIEENKQNVQSLAAQTKKLKSQVAKSQSVLDKMGGNLAEYDDLKKRQELHDQKQSVKSHLANLEQQFEYETARDLEAPIEAVRKRIAKKQSSLEALEAKIESTKDSLETAQSELAEAEKALAKLQKSEAKLDKSVQKAQAVYKTAESETSGLKKQISQEEAGLERLRGKLHETLQKARVDKVELPRIDEEDSVRSHKKSASASQRAATQFSQADHPVVMRDQEEAGKVDYSELADDYKSKMSDRDEKRTRKDLEDRIASIASAMEAITPNLKAQEAFENSTAKLKESKSSHEKAKDEANQAAKEFSKLKSRRNKLFLKAFTHIETALKKIYTEMTVSSKHPMGGNAYLSLDDPESPSGIKFNAMPPMKRFRDMEQLSGGEKTVAALSLLFAIHSFHPAPFFVMDEVDAALDNINLRKLTHYVSVQNYQCIVISLKDAFYEQSDSLVGICKDQVENSSRALTLDLRKYKKRDSSGTTPAKSPKRRRTTLSIEYGKEH